MCLQFAISLATWAEMLDSPIYHLLNIYTIHIICANAVQYRPADRIHTSSHTLTDSRTTTLLSRQRVSFSLLLRTIHGVSIRITNPVGGHLPPPSTCQRCKKCFKCAYNVQKHCQSTNFENKGVLLFLLGCCLSCLYKTRPASCYYCTALYCDSTVTTPYV
jgi:hypothetical protein